MKRRIMTGAATLGALALVLTACSSGDNGTSSSSSGDTTTDGTSETTDSASGEAVTISWAGWGLTQTPEFETLAEDFHAKHPNITVDLKDYDTANYETQITADLAAGSAPDLYTIKQLMTFPTFQQGGQLMDVSDVTIPANVQAGEYYAVDGVQYAVPYRMDSWFLYYNADLFKEAGVDIPDGKWTWEDYATTAEQLTKAFQDVGKTDVKGTYQHSWQSTVQGFANAQGQPDGAFLEGQWDYMVPFYENSLTVQDSGSQVDFGAIAANSLTYGGQFGSQKTAMLPMGSWYMAGYLDARASGDAETFEWGIAPAPQVSSDTFENPVTFGSPTGVGINPKIDADKVDAAKEFLAYLVSEDAGVALAKIGITPAVTSDAVADAMFSADGMPTDDQSKWTFSTHQTNLEVPLGTDSPALNNILKDAHTAIMSGSSSPTDAIASAMNLAKTDVLG